MIGTHNKIQHTDRLDGKYFKDLWKVNVKHALYHQDGTWYENLRYFPGALFDFNGIYYFHDRG